MALRVPPWSKNFVAKVDGIEYKGVAGQYLVIKKVWKTNATIEVSFDLTTAWLDGGKSYPGYVAIKTGTQVLAFDQALNPSITDLDKIEVSTNEPVALPIAALPNILFNKQAYKLNGWYKGDTVELTLLPFAEAGQSEGEVRVWLKRK